jgi:type III secretion system low calcium response chaperone LcrH/SycD
MTSTPSAVSDQLIEQVSAHLAQGGTLGDLRGLTEAEYEAAYYVGSTLYERGQFEEAGQVFAFLVMNNPYDRRFSQALGSALQMRQQYAEAIGYYMAATLMDASDPVPVFHIAECMAAQGQLDNARDALGFVVRLCKTPAQAELRARAEAMLALMARAGNEPEATA